MSNQWWLCPNTPPCPHGAALHDIEDFEDTRPTCCADDCACGQPTQCCDLHRPQCATPTELCCCWRCPEKNATSPHTG